jgi:hypothetical protein
VWVWVCVLEKEIWMVEERDTEARNWVWDGRFCGGVKQCFFNGEKHFGIWICVFARERGNGSVCVWVSRRNLCVNKSQKKHIITVNIVNPG